MTRFALCGSVKLIDQVRHLTGYGIKSIALTAETAEEDRSIWRRVENGAYCVVYGTPEILLDENSYFFKRILRHPNCAFRKKLVACALDECHVIEGWAYFRPHYRLLGCLRDCLSNIPFLAFSATITPVGISNVIKSSKLRDPFIIKESIRRRNIRIWIAPIQGKGYEDLRILIPEEASEARSIPQTFVFVDSTLEANRLTRWLRRIFPERLKGSEGQIVRAYSSPLDEISKEETWRLFEEGSARIMVCTDACTLGINIPAVPRVIQWKLNSDIGIDCLYQRFGRAGRDSDETAVAVVFITKANLSHVEKPSRGSDPVGSVEAPASFNYALPFEQSNWSTIQRFLPELYLGPTIKQGRKQRRTEKALVPAIKSLIHTTGCRHRPILAAFGEANIFVQSDILDCDNCHMEHLIRQDNKPHVPSVHGIPFSITSAYLRSIPTPPPPRRHNKSVFGKVNQERLDHLDTAIRLWRDHISMQKPYMSPSMVLTDTALKSIQIKIRQIGCEVHLKEVLEGCGYAFPESLLTPHLSSLWSCIYSSLKQTIGLQFPHLLSHAASSQDLRTISISMPSYCPQNPSPISGPQQVQSAPPFWPIPRLPALSSLLPVRQGDIRMNTVPPHSPSQGEMALDALNQHGRNDSKSLGNKIHINIKRVRDYDPSWLEQFISETKKARKI